MSDADPECRWCHYCGVDCIDYDTIEVPHQSDCPVNTGLYPVEGLLEPYGANCMDCSTPFELGDFYVLVRQEGIKADIVCVGCGVMAVANGS